MKNLNTILVSAVVALAVAWFAVVKLPQSAQSAKTESAYERVLRTGAIRCGYVSWAPYYIKDLKTGAVSGLNMDVMTALGEELGLKIEWAEEVGWGNLGEGLKTGRYDMVCTSAWPDAAKAKTFILSRPMFYSQLYPYVRADDDRFDGKPERINQSDIRVAAIDGAFSYNLAKSHYPQAQIVALPAMATDAEYLTTVADNKADIIIKDADEIKAYMDNNPGKLRRVKDVPPVHVFPQVMMFAPDEAQLADKINYALQMLIDNGVMETIKNKYKVEYLLPATSYAKPDQEKTP